MPPSSRRRCSDLFVIALLIGALAGIASADRGDVTAYKEALDEGAAHFAAGEYARARDSFADAYAIHPDPVLLFNIASTYRREGKRKSAIKAYIRFLDEAEPGDPRIDLASETIDALEDALEMAENAERMAAEAARSTAAKQRAEAEAEERRAENARLRSNLVAGGKPAPPADSGRTVRRVGVAIGVVGALALGGSAYDARRAQRAEQTLEGATRWDRNQDELFREGESARQRALILGITGGALLTTGVIVYLTGRRSTASRAIEISPAVDDDSVGAVLSGRF